MDKVSEMMEYRLKEYAEVFTENFVYDIVKLIDDIWNTYKQGGKILICGNGGSAADSLHFVAELVGRFRVLRRPISSIALNSDVATITAIANDFDYKNIFARQIEALAQKGDILIVISTSGKSSNVLEAIHMANKIGINTTALLGCDGGEAAEYINHGIIIPNFDTAIVQEIHQMIIHIVCDIIEKKVKNE